MSQQQSGNNNNNKNKKKQQSVKGQQFHDPYATVLEFVKFDNNNNKKQSDDNNKNDDNMNDNNNNNKMKVEYAQFLEEDQSWKRRIDLNYDLNSEQQLNEEQNLRCGQHQTLIELSESVKNIKPSSTDYIKKITLKYEFNNDCNGLFFNIGTKYNTKPYDNPSKYGLIGILTSREIKSSSSTEIKSAGRYSLTGRDTTRFFMTENMSNATIEMQLPINTHILPTHYTIRTGDNNNYHLRNWKLMGKHKGYNEHKNNPWIVIKNHVEDHSLNKLRKIATWQLPSKIYNWRTFCCFKILQTGFNSNYTSHLALSSIEFYGDVHVHGWVSAGTHGTAPAAGTDKYYQKPDDFDSPFIKKKKIDLIKKSAQKIKHSAPPNAKTLWSTSRYDDIEDEYDVKKGDKKVRDILNVNIQMNVDSEDDEDELNKNIKNLNLNYSNNPTANIINLLQTPNKPTIDAPTINYHLNPSTIQLPSRTAKKKIKSLTSSSSSSSSFNDINNFNKTISKALSSSNDVNNLINLHQSEKISSDLIAFVLKSENDDVQKANNTLRKMKQNSSFYSQVMHWWNMWRTKRNYEALKSSSTLLSSSSSSSTSSSSTTQQQQQQHQNWMPSLPSLQDEWELKQQNNGDDNKNDDNNNNHNKNDNDDDIEEPRKQQSLLAFRNMEDKIFFNDMYHNNNNNNNNYISDDESDIPIMQEINNNSSVKPQLNSLNYSSNNNNNKKSFQCEVCNKWLSTKTTLQHHKNRYHTGLKPYKCGAPNCHIRYSSTGARYAHEKTKHNKNYSSYNRNKRNEINASSSSLQYEWDLSQKSPYLQVFADGCTVANLRSDNNWQAITSNTIWKSGKHSFEVNILEEGETTNTWKFIVGFVPKKFDVTLASTSWIGSFKSWGYIGGNGGKCHIDGDSSAPHSNYGQKYGANDIIRCVVNFTTNTIRFYRNGQDQGIAFDDLDDDDDDVAVRPGVSMTGKGAVIRIQNVR